MKTIGIDLAGENSPTGICVLEWSNRNATVKDLSVAKRDISSIAQEVQNVWNPRTDAIGIDAPFDFPIAFSEAVTAMRTGGQPPQGDPRWRLTEKYIKQTKNPLSSVTSLITNTVSGRCYPLRHALVGQKCVDRIGYSTRIFEVYPAAALVSWGIIPVSVVNGEPSYKRSGDDGNNARQGVLDKLLQCTTCNGSPWLIVDDDSHQQLQAKDDAIDALVSALVARVAMNVSRPTDPAHVVAPQDLTTVQREGWIHLPGDRSLDCLPSEPTI